MESSTAVFGSARDVQRELRRARRRELKRGRRGQTHCRRNTRYNHHACVPLGGLLVVSVVGFLVRQGKQLYLKRKERKRAGSSATEVDSFESADLLEHTVADRPDIAPPPYSP